MKFIELLTSCVILLLFQTNSIFAQETTDSSFHIVKENENLFRISLRYNLALDSLILWNNLDQDFKIEAGQKLIISKLISDSYNKDTKDYYPAFYSEPVEPSSFSGINENGRSFFNHSTFIFKVFIFINLYFFVSSIFLLIIILFMRIFKKIKNFKINKCQDRLRNFITGWLYKEYSEEDLKSLSRDMRNRTKREVFTSELLSLHTNLTGESAEKLVDLFHKAGLKKYSIKKIHSIFWNRKAKGFRELVQMRIYEENQSISKYLNSKNNELRIEAQLAWIELNPNNPNSFLDDTNIVLTDWWQLNALISLKKIGEIPDFGRWIESANDSVAIFAIKMVGIFRQYANIDLVVKRLGSSNHKVRLEAIITLGKIALPAPISELQRLYQLENFINKTQILNSLTLISDSDNMPFFYNTLLYEKEIFLRILSAKGLVSLGPVGIDKINLLLLDADDVLKKIIIHAKDDRI